MGETALAVHDVAGPGGGPAGRPSVPDYLGELRGIVAHVETTAREWGIRPDSQEGKFVSAFLGSVHWLGRVGVSSQAAAAAQERANRVALDAEIAAVRELAVAATAAVDQARNAQRNLEIEEVRVVDRMVEHVLPLFMEKMQGALVIRERGWNLDQKRRRLGATIAATLAVFLGGFVVGVWDMSADTRALMMIQQCMTNPYQVTDVIVCRLGRAPPAK